jgi:dTDP-4-amino-4,6-dideoxygalactose transaminase
VNQYDLAFKGFSNFSPAQSVGRDLIAHHLYLTRIIFDDIGISRVGFMARLRQKGIGSQVHYIPITIQPFYKRFGVNPSDYPFANQYYSEALSLPLYVGFSDEEQRYVVDEISKIIL